MIIGYQIFKITAERNTSVIPEDPIQVGYNVSTTSVGKDSASKTLRFGFNYDVSLNDNKSNNIGKIHLEGAIIYAAENVDDIYKTITDSGKLDKAVQQEIVQGISNFSIMEAMQIAKQIQLPPLIKLPDLTQSQEKQTADQK